MGHGDKRSSDKKGNHTQTDNVTDPKYSDCAGKNDCPSPEENEMFVKFKFLPRIDHPSAAPLLISQVRR